MGASLTFALGSCEHRPQITPHPHPRQVNAFPQFCEKQADPGQDQVTCSVPLTGYVELSKRFNFCF